MDGPSDRLILLTSYLRLSKILQIRLPFDLCKILLCVPFTEHIIEFDRAEFLGDCIIKFVIGEALFRQRPDYHAGELSLCASYLLSRSHFENIMHGTGIYNLLIIQPGCHEAVMNSKQISDILEILIGLVFIQTGIEYTSQLILTMFADGLLLIGHSQCKRFKSMLQELLANGLSRTHPSYVFNKGLDNRFNCAVLFFLSNRKYIFYGWGRNKKQASEMAALKAYIALFSQRLLV
jgi:ribonuclease-3